MAWTLPLWQQQCQQGRLHATPAGTASLRQTLPTAAPACCCILFSDDAVRRCQANVNVRPAAWRKAVRALAASRRPQKWAAHFQVCELRRHRHKPTVPAISAASRPQLPHTQLPQAARRRNCAARLGAKARPWQVGAGELERQAPRAKVWVPRHLAKVKGAPVDVVFGPVLCGAHPHAQAGEGLQQAKRRQVHHGACWGLLEVRHAHDGS